MRKRIRKRVSHDDATANTDAIALHICYKLFENFVKRINAELYQASEDDAKSVSPISVLDIVSFGIFRNI